MRQCLPIAIMLLAASIASAQQPTGLEKTLLETPVGDLAATARENGDPARGAVLFHQEWMSCTKCHSVTEGEEPLGPHLARIEKQLSDADLIESILLPSKTIKEGYETRLVETIDGNQITGLLEGESDAAIELRDPTTGKRLTIPRDDIEAFESSPQSIMPTGLVAQLNSEQQFADLIAYLFEIRDGGLPRAQELQPLPSQYASAPLPAYEATIDHAGMIQGLDNDAFQRGEAIYNRLCVNCHGTQDRPGSLPTSLKFASGKFKNGSDPYSMYQTLTRGFGLMVSQRWMVPQQKYDVIHYIRESYLREHNPSQYADISEDYLAGLPAGDSFGPAPSKVEPWNQMDYGPSLIATYEIGDDGSNFAYKGNAIRLDAGPGGIAQGNQWIIYDLDTMRVAAAWQGKGFIDWNGINFNGRHAIHPRIVGDLLFENKTGPGWGEPGTQTFEDPRFVGRDGRKYGPLPRPWAQYRGMYHHGPDTILNYTVGNTPILEMPSMARVGETPIIKRHVNLEPSASELTLQVAQLSDDKQIQSLEALGGSKFVAVQSKSSEPQVTSKSSRLFDGSHYVEVENASSLEMKDEDWTFVARVRTKSDGVVFAKTAPRAEWIADGKSLFIRGGRLTFDIGWVGAVSGKTKISDGKWHQVAAMGDAKTGTIRLFVDGELDGQGELRPENEVRNHVLRIGYCSENFPNKNVLKGQLENAQFFQSQLSAQELTAIGSGKPVKNDRLVASWKLENADETSLASSTDDALSAQRIQVGSAASTGLQSATRDFLAGVAGDADGLNWELSQDGALRLVIPASDQPRRITIYQAAVDAGSEASTLAASVNLDDASLDLSQRLSGGTTRWPEVIEATADVAQDEGPFAVDVLNYPTDNPWFCRMRLTGFDFFEDGDTAAVADWDGNIWLVRGLAALPNSPLEENSQLPITWKRIASGLFQPLGLKVIAGKIYVTCRDQICILHDLNGDEETDFYESFNNDHQVTDHFHEFAMGLQRDAEGNLYYAKSARHALTALVPHHGTLLKVSPDGETTEILATGFRAANGVCLNPDGTFFVTDQEGHWNPKNRINWVKPGGFYGNMFGYHDVEDSSDDAMEQPLCWITNSFDRSPSELLWVDSDRWGPLNGALLNLSYGYGKVYVVPYEKKNGIMQGGMCELPIPQFPTGTMRGRFREADGQLYLCGMFAWAGTQHQDGGFYRLRYTGQPVELPLSIEASEDKVALTFSGAIKPESIKNLEQIRVKSWSLKRTASYGSKHYDEKRLKVTEANLSDDGKTVTLTIPELEPTWCMEIRYSFEGTESGRFSGVIHNTIHSTE